MCTHAASNPKTEGSSKYLKSTGNAVLPTDFGSQTEKHINTANNNSLYFYFNSRSYKRLFFLDGYSFICYNQHKEYCERSSAYEQKTVLQLHIRIQYSLCCVNIRFAHCQQKGYCRQIKASQKPLLLES